jgi:quercetin dioxygenase-like cupin family protein
MRTWDVSAMNVAQGQPEVLHSAPEGRAIAIQLDAGTELGDHQVYEGAWLMVARGRVRVRSSAGGEEQLGPGALAAFDPRERHEVAAMEDSRLLLLLSPWPGEGHAVEGPG